MQKISPTTVFLAFVLLLFAGQSFSQDRIVLISGDTIQCTIGKVTRNTVKYSQRSEGITAKGEIDKSKIREMSFQQKAKAEIKKEQVVFVEKADPVDTAKTEKPEGGRFRVSLHGGLGHLTGNTEEAEESFIALGASPDVAANYYKSLKNGYFGTFTAYYKLNADYWLGAKYQSFYTNAEVYTPLTPDGMEMYYGRAGERIFVNFAGVSLYSMTRVGKNKKLGFNSSVTIGPAFYRNETEIFNEHILFKGATLGTDVTIGAEYFISPGFSLTFDTSYFMAKLRNVNITTLQGSQDVELEGEQAENFSRLHLALGVVFYW